MRFTVLMKIEFLWLQDCPNHQQARTLLLDLLCAKGIETEVDDIDATDPSVANEYRFPGSPTIRIDGRDVEPGFEDPGDYTPRCRLYFTSGGIRGAPEAAWVSAAI